MGSRWLLTVVIVLLAATNAAVRADEAPWRFARDREIDVEHMRLACRFDLHRRTIEGEVTITARSVAVPLRSVTLDARDLEIASVRDGSGRVLAFRGHDDKLEIGLAEPLSERGSPLQLEIRYRARPRRGLNWFGPTPTDPDVPLQVWSQNEPDLARAWFPCVDTPEQRQAFDFEWTVPEGFTVVSNGTPLGAPEPVGPGEVRWRFRQRQPMPCYLVSVVVGRFVTRRARWGELPLAYHVPPDRADDLERSFARTPEMLAFFSERLGVPYPWPKYEQVVVEQFSYGGMENTGATTLNERTLHSERAALDTTSEPLVAHELAHQWFGDLVTCRDWSQLWLNEGWATFLAACWEEHARGPAAYAWTMRNQAQGALYGGRTTPLVRHRYREPEEMFRGPTYPKGAWVLHMLRRRLGETDFWAGVRDYLETHRNGAVESVDLRRALERRSGRSLGRFFEQWVYGAGHPELEVEVRWQLEGGLLSVRIAQRQKTEPFVFPFAIAITEDDGSRRVVPFEVTRRTTQLLLPQPRRPAAVGIDPGQQVLAALTVRGERDLWIRTLRNAPSPVSRWRAAMALAGDRHAEAVASLERAAATDAVLPVRRLCVQALGHDGDERRRAALLRLLAQHRDEAAGLDARGRAVVRREIVSALGRFDGDEAVRRALRALAEPGTEPSVRVQTAAVRVLARHPRTDEQPLFERLVEQRSTNEQLAIAAVDGLAALQQAAGLERLRALARPLVAPPPVRMAALRALGRVAGRRSVSPAVQDEVARELAAVLAERSERFREAALAGLRAMGAAGRPGIAALEALAGGDPDPALREQARGALEAVRRGKSPDAELARLRDRIETLTGRAEALGKRLERLEAEEAGGRVDGKARRSVPD